jgi:hypothetical protein
VGVAGALVDLGNRLESRRTVAPRIPSIVRAWSYSASWGISGIARLLESFSASAADNRSRNVPCVLRVRRPRFAKVLARRLRRRSRQSSKKSQ